MKTLFAIMLTLSFSAAFAGESMSASCADQVDGRSVKSIDVKTSTTKSTSTKANKQ